MSDTSTADPCPVCGGTLDLATGEAVGGTDIPESEHQAASCGQCQRVFERGTDDDRWVETGAL